MSSDEGKRIPGFKCLQEDEMELDAAYKALVAGTTLTICGDEKDVRRLKSYYSTGDISDEGRRLTSRESDAAAPAAGVTPTICGNEKDVRRRKSCGDIPRVPHKMESDAASPVARTAPTICGDEKDVGRVKSCSTGDISHLTTETYLHSTESKNKEAVDLPGYDALIISIIREGALSSSERVDEDASHSEQTDERPQRNVDEAAIEPETMDERAVEPVSLPPAVGEYINADAVTERDVLAERGGKGNHHPGNIRYRTIVSKLKARYKNAAKKSKTKIAKAIVKVVHRNGGRFLKKCMGRRYRVMTKAKARKKTSQALREKGPLKWTDGDFKEDADEKSWHAASSGTTAGARSTIIGDETDFRRPRRHSTAGATSTIIGDETDFRRRRSYSTGDISLVRESLLLSKEAEDEETVANLDLDALYKEI